MVSYWLPSRVQALQVVLIIVILFFNAYSCFYEFDIDPCDGCIYDYVVVGGGVAGSVVTGRLVEAGFSVLLIDADDLQNLKMFYIPELVNCMNNLDSCNESSEVIRRIKSKLLLEPGAINYMMYTRGNPVTYSRWSNVVNDSSWKWESMMKYFKKVENLKSPVILNSAYRRYHGVNGKINVFRDPNSVCDKYIKGYQLAGEPTPLDNVGNASLGFSRSLFNIKTIPRNEAAYAYIMPVADNPRFYLSLFTLATKIIFNKYKVAVGVELVKNGRKITVKARKEVILSAGTIRSPQLLMLSGIGREEDLKKWNLNTISDLPVGENLRNVVGVLLPFKTNKTASSDTNVHKYRTPLVVGYSVLNKSKTYSDYSTVNFITDDYKTFLSICRFGLAYNKKICNKYAELKNYQVLTTVLCNFNINTRSKIVLMSTDPADLPAIANYSSTAEDLDAAVQDIQHYLKVVSTSYFQNMGLRFVNPTEQCNQYKRGTKLYWKCYATCMMVNTAPYVGTNSLGSVVDSKFRVYGVKKLRVVDASVLYTTVSIAIFGAVSAVAEKAAEIIIAAGNQT